jgi:hypothetical protein
MVGIGREPNDERVPPDGTSRHPAKLPQNDARNAPRTPQNAGSSAPSSPIVSVSGNAQRRTTPRTSLSRWQGGLEQRRIRERRPVRGALKEAVSAGTLGVHDPLGDRSRLNWAIF